MRIALDRRQREELEENCLLIDARHRDKAFSMPAKTLLAPDSCLELLDRLGPVLGSSSRHITASLLAKRLAFLTTGSALYAMSAMDRGLDLSVDNFFVEFRHEHALWRSRMPLSTTTASCPRDGARQEWRDEVISNLFANGLAPIINSLNAVARTPISVLWENVAVRVYSLYEKRLATERHLGHRTQITDDFHYLVNDAPARLFGTRDNPLQRYFLTRKTCCSDSPRIRKTCCYYYRASDPVEFCSTCPLPRAIQSS